MVFNIAIVGAGPAGCMLARLLLQADGNIKVTLFEGEQSINFRSQGGSLDLHEKTGQAALKRGDLFDEFLKYARYDGEAVKIADKKMLCYVKQGASTKGSITGRPEIDRPKLRQLLFESLPANAVRWGKRLVSVEENNTLRFADDSTANGFDLIVGADGAWSRVRPFLSDVKPYYSGIAGHSLSIPNAEQTVPELYELVNRGSLFAFSDGKSVMAQWTGEGSINVGTWAVRPTDWQQKYDVHDATAVKAALLEEYSDWDPRLLALLQSADDDTFVPRDLFMLPTGHSWKHVHGVTLIGDAAHLITPFAGEGVNLALEDALRLSEAILAAAGDASPQQQLDCHVERFEAGMFRRATATQELTYDMMCAMYFTEGAPRNGIERYILRAAGDELGPVLTALLTPVVYIWFFVFKCIW